MIVERDIDLGKVSIPLGELARCANLTNEWPLDGGMCLLTSSLLYFVLRGLVAAVLLLLQHLALTGGRAGESQR